MDLGILISQHSK